MSDGLPSVRGVPGLRAQDRPDNWRPQRARLTQELTSQQITLEIVAASGTRNLAAMDADLLLDLLAEEEREAT